MKKIVLLRHGESAWNKENRFTGWTDVDLTEKGVAEAEKAGETLKEYQARHIVVDPVMVATSGAALLEPDAVKILKEKLLPLAEVITPNIPETQILWGRGIHSAEEMEQAAKRRMETIKTTKSRIRITPEIKTKTKTAKKTGSISGQRLKTAGRSQKQITVIRLNS